jgi:hypothetical protein
MLTSFYKRVVLIPFAISLITITICFIHDYSGDYRPAIHYTTKGMFYPLMYIFSVANLLAMAAGCLTIFLNNYPLVRNNIVLSAATWVIYPIDLPVAFFIISKGSFSGKGEVGTALIVWLVITLVPFVTSVTEFIKYRRSLLDKPQHISS